MKTSRDGILFIAGREALVLVAYEDGENKDGTPRYSIGFGDNSAKKGDRITTAAAWEKLVKAVREREKIVNRHLTESVTQGQFDAIMSAYYQGGTRNLLPLAAAVNAGQAAQIPDILPSLDTNLKGEHKPGLRKRREAEAKIARDNDYGTLTPIPMWRGDPRKTARYEYAPTAADRRIIDA
jgi:GH24 family phage-related lysozyme (muramidase)